VSERPTVMDLAAELQRLSAPSFRIIKSEIDALTAERDAEARRADEAREGRYLYWQQVESLHLAFQDGQWVDTRCGCAYHPDDRNGTHGGGPHVHSCADHMVQHDGTSLGDALQDVARLEDKVETLRTAAGAAYVQLARPTRNLLTLREFNAEARSTLEAALAATEGEA